MVRRSVTRDDFNRADKIEQLLKIYMTQVVDPGIRAVVLTNVMVTFSPYKCGLAAFFLFLSLVFPILMAEIDGIILGRIRPMFWGQHFSPLRMGCTA